jgi:hypothetical protein
MFAISRSRVTLATIEAAAIDTDRPSPPTIVSHGQGSAGRAAARECDRFLMGRTELP